MQALNVHPVAWSELDVVHEFESPIPPYYIIIILTLKKRKKKNHTASLHMMIVIFLVIAVESGEKLHDFNLNLAQHDSTCTSSLWLSNSQLLFDKNIGRPAKLLHCTHENPPSS